MEKRALIQNAFKPSSEIKNPKTFSGRKEEILDLVDALLSDGSCPIIYGERGLGKSSLAFQIARISLGDKELLAEIGKADRAVTDSNRYIPVLYTCTDQVKNLPDLFDGIVGSSQAYTTLKEMDAETPGLNFSEIRYELNKEYESQYGIKFDALSPEDRFINIIRKTITKHNKKLLFVVDEFDRINVRGGMSSFIKRMSSSKVKFILVGVAANISSLLHEHESIERHLVPVNINIMDNRELGSIPLKVQSMLAAKGVVVKFTEEAVAELVSAADGYPWFVHVIGQEALKIVSDEERSVVHIEDVKSAISNLASSRFAQKFSSMYILAVGDSIQREYVLRLMAKWRDQNIPLSEIYIMAKQLQVTNPTNCKKDLCDKKYGEAIYVPIGVGGRVVRFNNAMFKRYINLRGAIYAGVVAAIGEAWKKRHPSPG